MYAKVYSYSEAARILAEEFGEPMNYADVSALVRFLGIPRTDHPTKMKAMAIDAEGLERLRSARGSLVA